jgi:hypothetical protein
VAPDDQEKIDFKAAAPLRRRPLVFVVITSTPRAFRRGSRAAEPRTHRRSSAQAPARAALEKHMKNQDYRPK